MSEGMRLSIQGLEGLNMAFKTLPEKTQRALIRSELRGALKPVLTAARALARRRSGTMASTLKLRAMKPKRGRVGYYIRTGTRAEIERSLSRRGTTLARRVLGGGRYSGKTRKRLQVIGHTLRRVQRGERFYYPAIIELGTRGKGGRVAHRAYPFMRAGFDSQQPRILENMVAGLNDAIEEAMQ